MDKLFDTKRTYIGYDGDEYIDMVIPVADISKLESNSLVKLNHDNNGRIDTFTWCNAGHNMDLIDSVMYANHIFNPFSVKEEDLLYVPVDNDKLYYSSTEPTLPDGTKHSNNTQGKKSMTYAQKIEYLAKKGLGVK